MKKGYIVIEMLNNTVFLYYAKNRKKALEFVITRSTQYKTNGGFVRCLDEKTGYAWGENKYGLPWSFELQTAKDIIII